MKIEESYRENAGACKSECYFKNDLTSLCIMYEV